MVLAALLSNSATMRKAKLELLFTAGILMRSLVWAVNAVVTVAASGKSTKLEPLVVYWRRTYLLPVLLARWSQRMLISRLPEVLTLNRTPAVLFPVPWT